MSASAIGTIYLVGAGPGDPDLLTVKAARLLAQADVVLHDDLVPRELLDLAARDALTLSVGKRCGNKRTTQAAIHDLMIASARRGLRVVRLQCGDPLIFGRAGEEMDALRAAGIPFEVVPGVTAASAAAALVGASLTDRRSASKLIVLSGHSSAVNSGKKRIPSLPEDATLAVYMPGPDVGRVASDLLAQGLPGSTPCVLVSDASRPGATFQAVRLAELSGLTSSAGPRLLLAGKALEAVLRRQNFRRVSGEFAEERFSEPSSTVSV